LDEQRGQPALQPDEVGGLPDVVDVLVRETLAGVGEGLVELERKQDLVRLSYRLKSCQVL
jgi:hypothetical protein